eukprot:m.78620 g.78620  ORF g.78620 m.78620 type:complete len:351 (+) comp12679_c0_seq2:159-1211(+)
MMLLVFALFAFTDSVSGSCSASTALPNAVPPSLPKLVVPEWTWKPDEQHATKMCLNVPTTKGVFNNESVMWVNNSREIFAAIPATGTMPPNGWPVLIDLTIDVFPSSLQSNDNSSGCGWNGETPPMVDPTPLNPSDLAKCKVWFPFFYKMYTYLNTQEAATEVCPYTANASFINCTYCLENQNNSAKLVELGCDLVGKYIPYLISEYCPAPPTLPQTCHTFLNSTCSRYHKEWTYCSKCVMETAAHNYTNYFNHCPHIAEQEADWAYCGKIPLAHGYYSHYDEDYLPFDDPLSFGMHCPCFNGSTYPCTKSSPSDPRQPHLPNSTEHCDIEAFLGVFGGRERSNTFYTMV